MEKTITIRYTGLTQTANLMLCLTPPDGTKIGADNNLVAWKVIAARPNQDGSATVVYSARYGFGQNELDQGNKVQGSIVREVSQGKSVDLVEEGSGYPMWGTPYNNNTKLMKAYNRTRLARTMSVGTVKGSGASFTYEPTFIWRRVGINMFIEAQLTPKILCYVNLGYQETDIIRADISSDLIKEIDLATLPASSTFIFAEGPQGGYTLEPLVDNNAQSPSSPKLPRVPSTPTSLPPVKINYDLKLHWNKAIDSDAARAAIEHTVALCNTRGLVCVANPDDRGGRFSTFNITRKGYTGHRIHDIFKTILADTTNSNWSIEEEKWTNVSYQEGGKDVLELIAPGSLAWHYAK